MGIIRHVAQDYFVAARKHRRRHNADFVGFKLVPFVCAKYGRSPLGTSIRPPAVYCVPAKYFV